MGGIGLPFTGRARFAAVALSALLACGVVTGGATAAVRSVPPAPGSSIGSSTRAIASGAGQNPADRKLIEFGCLECGSGTHTPGMLRRTLATVEASPFDGVMVRPSVGASIFTTAAYPDSAFAQDRQDLAAVSAVSSTRLTDNFLLIQTSPASTFDWFDDRQWAAVDQNLRNVAQLARVGGFKGIALDSENYNADFQLFGYPWQTRRDQQTFRDYQQQVRKRGSEFVRAILDEDPGASVFSLGLTSWLSAPIPRLDDPAQEAYMATDDGGLWFYFVRGLLDGLSAGTDLIDGDEQSYYFRRAQAFDDSREFIRRTGRDATILDAAGLAKYDAHVTVGQAVYVDGLLNLSNWDRTIGYYLASDAQRRDMFEYNLYQALRASDRYVWVHSENMNWWTGDVPTGLADSVRQTRTRYDRALGPSVDVTSAVDAAYRRPGALTNLLGPAWATS